MMYQRRNTKGSSWGAGIGLLALLISVGIIIYLMSLSGNSGVDTPNKAVERAQKALKEQERQANQQQEAAPAPTTQPAEKSPPTLNSPTEKLDRSVEEHNRQIDEALNN